MSNPIKDLIRAIANKNSLKAEQSFKAALSQRIRQKLDNRRKQISKDMFG